MNRDSYSRVLNSFKMIIFEGTLIGKAVIFFRIFGDKN